MAFTGKEAEEFPIAKAAEWTSNYRNANPGKLKAHFFGKEIINRILNQEKCVGIRCYYALDENGVQQMIIVGADKEENDLFNGIVAEMARPCPPFCSSVGPLVG